MVRSDFIMEIRRYIVNPTERRLRAPWRVTIWVFLAGFGLVLLSGVVAVVSSLMRMTPAVAVTRQIALFAVGTTAAVVIGYLLDRRTLPDYGLGFDRQWWRDAAFGLVLGVGLPTLVLLVELAAGFVEASVAFATVDSGPLPLTAFGPLVAVLLLGAFFLVQATAEEVLVRGYLLTNAAEGLAGWVGKRRAVIAATALTGALFGVLHWTNPSASLLSVTNITLYGLLLGACYVLTGRLGVASGFHVAWNYTLALLGFPVSGLRMGVALLSTDATGPALVTGGEFGPEGGLIALPLLGVGGAALYWWVRREYGVVEILDGVATPDLRIRTRSDTANQDG
ncbi:CPBP family intramembrane metalloprotease [Haloarcula sp. CBA1130]|uniref:CPBP family intramembrane glutamic endopeptidase n=1 Tax=unclassified Haloarcula TaxID=2624677 RepID=UPI0012485121|nr:MULTISPECIES: type II CAAX endopeptidase family protein [unclassified Haloarcula]KAA9399260.1 CPBP family intramembrane metalloprotease [Haloarcula sp. CBA1129]KAA9403772.1 CPBP family intramembrane metalloprotease [Haloarcula sp. CBA1130]